MERIASKPYYEGLGNQEPGGAWRLREPLTASGNYNTAHSDDDGPPLRRCREIRRLFRAMIHNMIHKKCSPSRR